MGTAPAQREMWPGRRPPPPPFSGGNAMLKRMPAFSLERAPAGQPRSGHVETGEPPHHPPAGGDPGRGARHHAHPLRCRRHLVSARWHMGEPPFVAATDAPSQHTTGGTSARASGRGHGQRHLSATMIDHILTKVESGSDASCRENVSVSPEHEGCQAKIQAPKLA